MARSKASIALGTIPGSLRSRDLRKYSVPRLLKADANPGKTEQGHPLLDGPEGKYVPSEEELIVSEIGRRIGNILFNTNISHSQLEGYMEKNGIPHQELVYHEIHFSHSDIMGSGRFFYAEKAIEITRIKI